MIYLIASIISSTSIFILFKTAEKFSVRLILLITINYLVASILGLTILVKEQQTINFDTNWWVFAVILGIMFIFMFWLIGLSSQKSGITITTLASKMSLIFPVLFSIYWFKEEVTIFKSGGILLAIAAVLLSLYKKDIRRFNRFHFYLPLLIFIGGGFNDTLVKFVQTVQISDTNITAFTTFVFFTAFITGLIAVTIRAGNAKLKLNVPTLVCGILLGTANFGSLYFIIQALGKSNLESSLVFTLNHTLIVVLSAVAGTTIFKEQLNRVNFAGFILALLSLAILL